MHTLPGVLLCFSFDGHELRRPIDADWSPEIPGACRNLPVHPCRRARLIFPLKNRHFCAEISAHDLLIIPQNPVFFKSAIPGFRKNCAKTGGFLKQLTEKRRQIDQFCQMKRPGACTSLPSVQIQETPGSVFTLPGSQNQETPGSVESAFSAERFRFPLTKVFGFSPLHFSTMLSAPMRFASAPKS